jgi:hypothetical protein
MKFFLTFLFLILSTLIISCGRNETEGNNIPSEKTEKSEIAQTKQEKKPVETPEQHQVKATRQEILSVIEQNETELVSKLQKKPDIVTAEDLQELKSIFKELKAEIRAFKTDSAYVLVQFSKQEVTKTLYKTEQLFDKIELKRTNELLKKYGLHKNNP